MMRATMPFVALFMVVRCGKESSDDPCRRASAPDEACRIAGCREKIITHCTSPNSPIECSCTLGSAFVECNPNDANSKCPSGTHCARIDPTLCVDWDGPTPACGGGPTAICWFD